MTKLYSELAFEIANEKGLLGQRLHLDSTSFVMYGNYEDADSSPLATYGYSKEKRTDLKQVMLSLIQGGEANLPLWMEALDGNSSDKKSFHETVSKVKEFMNGLKGAPDNLCFVVDSAFYDIKKLAELDAVHWITRVPATVKDAQEWEKKGDIIWHKMDDNYQITSGHVALGGIHQRWVMVHSAHAHRREHESLHRKMQKRYSELEKKLWHLSHQKFGCPADADKAIKPIIAKLAYHQVNYTVTSILKHPGRGRPHSAAEKIVIGYQIEFTIASDWEKIAQIKQTLGRFILATNQLDTTMLTDEQVLKQYKEQSQVESGFKFIKNNAFELDSFFLHTPERIGALMMIMTLCLMVYNFSQYQLRQCLKKNNDVLPNQLGKPVQNPTIKWIAELMNVIAVVSINTGEINQQIVTNVDQVHRKVIAYFGKSALKIYGLPEDYQQVKIDYANYKNLLNWCEM